MKARLSSLLLLGLLTPTTGCPTTPNEDAGARTDTGRTDAGTIDAGTIDAGPLADAPPVDAASDAPLDPTTDAYAPDAPRPDSGPTDAGPEMTDCMGPVVHVNTTGNDATGDGTEARPWLSLAHAADIVTSGTIHIHRGTYTETETSRVRTGVCVEGDGPDTILRSTLSAAFVPIIALNSPEGTMGRQHISQLTLDGSNLRTSWAISVAGRSYVSVHDIVVRDFMETGVNFAGIENPAGSTEPTVYAVGNRFYNNNVSNSATNDGVYGRGNFQFGGQDGMLIFNNMITQPMRTPGTTGDIGWPVKMANEGHIRHCQFFNNTLIRTPFIGINGAGNNWNFAFEMWNVDDFNMYGNTFQGAVDFAGVRGLHFHDNVLSQPALNTYIEDGIRLETGETDVVIENNHFRNLAQGVIFSPHDYRSDGMGIDIHRITIQRNVFENMATLNGTAHSTIRFEGADSNPVTHVSDVFIYNNTFIAGTGANHTYFAVAGIGYTGTNRNIRVINNIFAHYSEAPIIFSSGFGGVVSTINELFIQNNDFFDNGHANAPRFTSPSTEMTVATAPGAMITDNVMVDPMLSADLHLPAGSPLIDGGREVGLPHTGSAPDIGAFERP